MNYKVRTLLRAKREMEAIVRYITEELGNPQAATNLLDALLAQIQNLSVMPKIFPLVSDKKLAKRGIRFVPVGNFTVFFTVDEDEKYVNIASVMYNRRDWGNLL